MLQEHTHSEISKAIVRSQHTQRNFDLSKRIPEEDMKLMMTAVTECPSKQNVAYYRVHFLCHQRYHQLPTSISKFDSKNLNFSSIVSKWSDGSLIDTLDYNIINEYNTINDFKKR